ncbi:hypothetical protein HDU93_005329 [Gonapodya sp. JEL0774]|nr:hypothetical protein HDU93_005329 [Gonapodya sp. JEL0774]
MTVAAGPMAGRVEPEDGNNCIVRNKIKTKKHKFSAFMPISRAFGRFVSLGLNSLALYAVVRAGVDASEIKRAMANEMRGEEMKAVVREEDVQRQVEKASVFCYKKEMEADHIVTGQLVVLEEAVDSRLGGHPNTAEVAFTFLLSGMKYGVETIKIVVTSQSVFIVTAYPGMFDAVTYAKALGNQAAKSPKEKTRCFAELEKLMYKIALAVYQPRSLGLVVCDMKSCNVVVEIRGNPTLMGYGMMMQARRDGTIT